MKKPPRRALPVDALLALALGLSAAFAVLATQGGFGITYDEPIYMGQGLTIAKWFGEMWRGVISAHPGRAMNRDAIEEAWYAGKDQQPPLVKVMTGLGQRAVDAVTGGRVPSSRPAGPIMFGLCVAGIYIFCRPLWGRTPAAFASLSFAAMPRVFYHAHLATLDVPVAALCLLTCLCYYRAARTDNWEWATLAGIFFGLGLLTKLNSAILLPALLIWSLLFWRRGLEKQASCLLVLGPVIFFLGWPWLWLHPLSRLTDYLRFQLRHYPVAVYYLGKMHIYAPWHYPFVVTGFTVPAGILLLFLIGLGAAIYGRGVRPVEGRLASICCLVYLAASAMPFAPKYNGVRLFMPAFPFIAILSGAGISAVSRAISHTVGRRLPGARSAVFTGWVAAILGLAAVVPAVRALVSTNPHQVAYYNFFARGIKGARKLGLETIYWGGPYLEALTYLNATAPLNGTVFVTPRGCISLLDVYVRSGLLRQDLAFVGPGEKRDQTMRDLARADVVIFQTAQSEFDDISRALYRRGRPDFVVELEGVPLLLAFKRDEVQRHFPPPIESR